MSTTMAPATRFTDVIVATDFSRESDRALGYAKSIVRASEGELLLVHVAKPAPHIAIPEGGWVDDPLRAQRERKETEAAGNALRAEAFRATALCPFGDVTEEVAEAARSRHADLVVVGTHGRRGFTRLLFGSHAQSLAEGLRIPVLVVGPKAPRPPAECWRPKHIICATTLDQRGALLVAFAYRFAQEHNAHLEIAYRDVAKEHKTYSDWQTFKRTVQDILRPEFGEDTHLHALSLEEPEAYNLVGTTSERHVDLLMMESRHRLIEWPASRSGGILPRVLAEAPCPILVIPSQTEMCSESAFEPPADPSQSTK